MKRPRLPAHVLLTDCDEMFVRRCAWHRKYHGHVKFLGVSSWRGWGMTFSDGMCTDCAARARAEWQLPPSSRPRPAPRIGRSFRPDFAFAAAVLLLGVAATFGVVVGPPRPIMNASIPATANVSAPMPEVAVGPTMVGPATSARPESTVQPPSTSRAERRPTPEPAPAPAPRVPPVVVEAPSATDYAAPARPIRVTRAAAKRPVLAAFQPVARQLPIETVSVREPAVVAATPAVWRALPALNAFQAP